MVMYIWPVKGLGPDFGAHFSKLVFYKKKYRVAQCFAIPRDHGIDSKQPEPS